MAPLYKWVCTRARRSRGGGGVALTFFFSFQTVRFFAGIGALPDAVLSNLTHHKDLGIHSEMFSVGVIDLVRRGCITNNKKTIHKGKIISSFLIGTKPLYDFVHNNPLIGESRSRNKRTRCRGEQITVWGF